MDVSAKRYIVDLGVHVGSSFGVGIGLSAVRAANSCIGSLCSVPGWSGIQQPPGCSLLSNTVILSNTPSWINASIVMAPAGPQPTTATDFTPIFGCMEVEIADWGMG